MIQTDLVKGFYYPCVGYLAHTKWTDPAIASVHQTPHHPGLVCSKSYVGDAPTIEWAYEARPEF